MSYYRFVPSFKNAPEPYHAFEDVFFRTVFFNVAFSPGFKSLTGHQSLMSNPITYNNY